MGVIAKVSDGYTIISGTVKYLKKGSGKAEDILTIVKYDCDGTSQKMLCWDGIYSRLSYKARFLEPGDKFTAKVKYEIGDPNLATCVDLKQTGLFKCKDEGGKAMAILVGVLEKSVRHGDDRTVCIFSVRYPKKKVYYRVLFADVSAEKAANLRIGQKVAVRGYSLREGNGKYPVEYYDLQGGGFEIL